MSAAAAESANAASNSFAGFAMDCGKHLRKRLL